MLRNSKSSRHVCKQVRALALAVAVSLLAMAACGSGRTTTAKNVDDEIIDVARSYIQASTEAVYLWAQGNQAADMPTILDIAKGAQAWDISPLLEKYSIFRAGLSSLPNDVGELQYALGLQAFIDNIELHTGLVRYFAAVQEGEVADGYRYFNASYDVANCYTTGDIAIVDLYESLDYQYAQLNTPTYEGEHFLVSLLHIGYQWYIVAVESDDDFRKLSGFNADEEIRGYWEAKELDEDVNYTMTVPSASESNVKVEPMQDKLPKGTAAYNYLNAINYAMTYSNAADNGNSTSSVANSMFMSVTNACMTFVSQCVWAGFGGSNAQSDINNKYGMDASGTYTWWCTGSAAVSSWTSCSNFRSYIGNMNSATVTETGLICDIGDVAYDSNSLSTSVGFTTNDLKGAVVHVNGSVALGHAVFINSTTGNTRSTAWFTSYNNCRKNVLLSSYYPTSTSDTNAKMVVIVPRTLRSCVADYRLWAQLLDQIPNNSTKSIISYCNTTCATLTTKVYNPSGTLISTFNNNNTSTAINSVTFNTVGLWKITIASVSSPALSTYTYTVRVV